MKSPVSFLIPNPKHNVSFYTFIFRINASWSGGKGDSYFQDTEEYLEIFLERNYRYRYSTRIVLNTGVICHYSPLSLPTSLLNRGSPVLLVTPSRSVAIQVVGGSLNISVVKARRP